MLGFGERTISQAGCLMVALIAAGNALNDNYYTVVRGNEVLKEANAFIGSALLVPVAARRLGMEQHRRKPEVDKIFEALESDKQLVIMGVDYKKGKSSGFSDADHFVLAYATGLTAGKKPVRTIVAMDPGTGTDVHFEEEGGKLVCRPSTRTLWKVTEVIYLSAQPGEM